MNRILVVIATMAVLTSMAMAVDIEGGLTTSTTGDGEAFGGQVITPEDGGLTIQATALIPDGGIGTAFASFEGADSNGGVSYDGKVDAFASKTNHEGEFRAWAAFGGAVNENGNSYAGALTRLTGEGDFGIATAEGLATAQQNGNYAWFDGGAIASGSTASETSVIACSEPVPSLHYIADPITGAGWGFFGAKFGELII